jgi:hypothetical protein
MEEKKLMNSLESIIRNLLSASPHSPNSIAFLSRFMQNLRVALWKALSVSFVMYLHYTKDMGLTYKAFQSMNGSLQLNRWVQMLLVRWIGSIYEGY